MWYQFCGRLAGGQRCLVPWTPLRAPLSRRRSRVRVPSLALSRIPQYGAVPGESRRAAENAFRSQLRRSAALRSKNVANGWLLARTPLSHLVGLTRPAEMRVSAGAEG